MCKTEMALYMTDSLSPFLCVCVRATCRFNTHTPCGPRSALGIKLYGSKRDKLRAAS